MADENPVSRDPADSRGKCNGCRDGGGREEIKGIWEWGRLSKVFIAKR